MPIYIDYLVEAQGIIKQLTKERDEAIAALKASSCSCRVKIGIKKERQNDQKDIYLPKSDTSTEK